MSYQMRRRPRWHAGAGAALVTSLAVVAGSMAATTAPASADGTTTTIAPAATTTVPAAATAQAGGLLLDQREFRPPDRRPGRSLDAAIKAVQELEFPGQRTAPRWSTASTPT